MRPESPVAIESLRPVSSGALVWRRSGRLSLTIVVKATLALVNEGTARITAPVDLCHGERALRPDASILADSDMVPYKPRVDVTYVGFAWAPRPVQGLRVRMAIHGDSAMMEKALQVVGERPSMSAQPSPFVRMPIVFERAWAGPQAENPVGVPLQSGRIANLFDPVDPTRPACFAPISRAFPSRQRLLAGLDARALETPVRDPGGSGIWAIDVPQNLPFDFFLAAPTDQRIDVLTGSETLLLENLIEGQSRLHTRLPSIKALAKVFGATLPPQGQAIDLIGDTIAIDGSDKTVSLTWRGTIPVPGTESLLRSLRVLTGIESAGYPMQWPSGSIHSTMDLKAVGVDPRAGRGHPDIAEEPTPMLDSDDEPSGSTQAISPEEAMKLLAGAKKALPFGGKAPPALEAPPGLTERTLSPAEASALARQLAEQMPPREADVPLKRPTGTGKSAAGASQPPPPLAAHPPPPPPARPGTGSGNKPDVATVAIQAILQPGAFSMPAVPPPAPVQPPPAQPPAVAKNPAIANPEPVPPPRWGQPDLVVRPPGFVAAPSDIDDEDSAIGSTVAFSPEAAAELIARRVAAGKPPGGTTPPPPRAAMPAAAVTAANSPMDDPVDSSAGSTVAFSPEAAAQLIAQRMGQAPGARPGVPAAPPPPAPPPPAPPPPAAPTGPTLTRTNTLVMDAPSEAVKDARKLR